MSIGEAILIGIVYIKEMKVVSSLFYDLWDMFVGVKPHEVRERDDCLQASSCDLASSRLRPQPIRRVYAWQYLLDVESKLTSIYNLETQYDH